MNIISLSQSGVNCYKDCEFKFFMEYILKLRRVTGKRAYLGQIVHKVLEILAKCKRNNHLSGKYIDHEYILDICWNRYVARNIYDFELKKVDFNFCKKTVEKVINSKLNPLLLNVIDVEKYFVIPLKDDNFKCEFYDPTSDQMKIGYLEIRGIIDLVSRENEDTIDITDYKTGQRKCWITGAEKDYFFLKEQDIQIKIYDLAAKLLYPGYKHRILSINFINDGGNFSIVFDDEDRKQTYQEIIDIYQGIKNNELPTRIKESSFNKRWKCRRMCQFGSKSNIIDGCDVCDRVFNHMIKYGMDETLIKINEKRYENKNQDNTN